MSSVESAISKKLQDFQFPILKCQTAIHPQSSIHGGESSSQSLETKNLENKDVEDGELVQITEKLANKLEKIMNGSNVQDAVRDDKTKESKKPKLVLRRSNKDSDKVTEVDEKHGEITKPFLIKENENIILSNNDKAIEILEMATEDKTEKRWNLRDRKSRLPKGARRNWEENNTQQNVTRKSGKGKEVKEEDKNVPKLPKFSLQLKLEEISEDIYAMTGSLPSKKTRKRSKNAQKKIDLIYPGGSLEVITIHKYKVSGNTRKAY